MDVHQLSDGTRVRIRPIAPSDKLRLAEGLRRLSPESVRRRFLTAKQQFSAAELRYLTEVDGRNHIAFVAVLDSDPSWLAGVARAVRYHDNPDLADLAIVVADPLQGKGLGTLLVDRLAEEARAVGIPRFGATMLGYNEPAFRLMRRLAPTLAEDRISNGLRDVVVELGAPAPALGLAA